MMARYRLRVVEVEAEQFRPGLEDEWAHQWRDGVLVGRYCSKDAADACPRKSSPGYYGETVPVVRTPTGRIAIGPGDWIVTNERGERVVMTPQAFATTYR